MTIIATHEDGHTLMIERSESEVKKAMAKLKESGYHSIHKLLKDS